MEILYEKIQPNPGSAFYLKKFEAPYLCQMPYWHQHPEVELVYVHRGNGKRHIGNHLSHYLDGELVMVGSQVPHAAFSNQVHEDNFEIVLQFHPEMIEKLRGAFPETLEILALIQRAKKGISFFGSTRKKAGKIMLDMLEQKGMPRMMLFLELFHLLAQSKSFKTLGVSENCTDYSPGDFDRLEKVFSFVEKNFGREISLDEVAALCHMTRNSFCRFFKKNTHKTLVQYINEYRVARACEELQVGSHPIAEVAYSVGFQHVPYFDKVFKNKIGLTPQQFRQQFQSLIRGSHAYTTVL